MVLAGAIPAQSMDLEYHARKALDVIDAVLWRYPSRR